MPSVLIIACDFFLAGIYGRKFERNNWDVEIAESVDEAKIHIAKKQPDIILVEVDCIDDIVQFVRSLRALPTTQHTKIILLAKEAERAEIQSARNAGADQYLLLGHFVPQEAIEKMRDLIHFKK